VNRASSTFPNLLTIKDHARCKREIESIIATEKEAFNVRKGFSTRKLDILDLNLRKKVVKCYIWSVALYGAET